MLSSIPGGICLILGAIFLLKYKQNPKTDCDGGAIVFLTLGCLWLFITLVIPFVMPFVNR
jgi:hypothetical protein